MKPSYTFHCYQYRFISQPISHSSSTPTHRYTALLRSYTIHKDPQQLLVVNELQDLFDKLFKYAPPQLPDTIDDSTVGIGTFATPSSSSDKKGKKSSKSLFARLFTSATDADEHDAESESEVASATTEAGIQGLYIYGTTGTGKTMLMDLFYASVETHSKQRVHFNKFMLFVHQQIHNWRENLKAQNLTPQEMRNFDPIPSIALQIAQQSTVLCFDEFQVTDIVDAVLLNRLFTALFHFGIIIIATSNREPNMLYLNGLQRDQVFLPFLTLFQSKLKVIDLNSVDYRDTGSNLKNTYFFPESESTEMAGFERAWTRIIESTDVTMQTVTEKVTSIAVMQGRTLLCPRCIGHSKATRFTFDQLCEENLGSADYISLSQHFSTVFIENVPEFSTLNRNAMKRFILLIDELYQGKNRVVCLAHASPNKLLRIDAQQQQQKGTGASKAADASASASADSDADNNDPSTKAKNDARIKNTFEDMFQFDRCASRLMEMQSQEYLDDFHAFWRTSESELVD